ncbi:MAG: response regulator, partial [Lachnospiraceae bacterium]|nr:response regulator [Lachnospiraceae bacterium]
VIGVKESFLIRVLIKKLGECGISALFSPAAIDEIDRRIEGVKMLTYYFDNETSINPGLLTFIADRLAETGKKIAVIGEKDVMTKTCEKIGSARVFGRFARPLDTDDFIATARKRLTDIRDMGERRSILIVDDDATYIGVIRGWLREEYKVSMANSGLQAIRWLAKNHADLILLDYEMPVTSGPQVLEMLRSEPETKNIPVIFLTGKGDKQSVMQVVSLKPEGYLLKTIKEHELKKELEEFFAARPR